MHHNLITPDKKGCHQDWSRLFLARNEYDECERELSDTFEDLQNTVQVMFDDEIAKRVREVERLGYYPEASFTPSRHKPNMHKTSNSSDSEPELKPEPLFSRRRVTKTESQCSPPSSYLSSGPGSPIESSATSSSDLTAPDTPVTYMVRESPSMVLGTRRILGEPRVACNPAPFWMAPQNLMRHSSEQATYPPRRSSLRAKTDMECADEHIRPATCPNGTWMSGDVDQSECSQQDHVMISEPAMERTISVELSTPSRKPTESVHTPTPTKSHSPFTKVWAPPPYIPSRQRTAATACNGIRSLPAEAQNKLECLQQQETDLRRRNMTSSLMLKNSPDALTQADGMRQVRKDSLSLMGTPDKPASSPIQQYPLDSSPLAHKKSKVAFRDQFITSAIPASEKLTNQIEKGLEALCCVDDDEHNLKRVVASHTHQVKRHVSTEHLASTASGHQQWRFSPSIANRQDQDHVENYYAQQAVWLQPLPPAYPEHIVDPNGLLTGPPRPYAGRTFGSRLDMARLPPPPSPLELLPSKRPQADVAGALPATSPGCDRPQPRRQRYGAAMERVPPKAIRVLGSIDTLAEIEAREEKEQRRAKKKRRMNEVLQAVSKALELG